MSIQPNASLTKIGLSAPVACLEPGAKACEHASECRTLTLWKGLDKVINDYLDNITIADLIHTNPDEYDYII